MKSRLNEYPVLGLKETNPESTACLGVAGGHATPLAYVAAGAWFSLQQPQRRAWKRCSTPVASIVPSRSRAVGSSLFRKTAGLGNVQRAVKRPSRYSRGWLGERRSGWSAPVPAFAHALATEERLDRQRSYRVTRWFRGLVGCSDASKASASRPMTGFVPRYHPDEILGANVAALVQKVRTGTWTATQVAERYLQRVRETEPFIGAYLLVDDQLVLEQAATIDQKRQRGEPLGLLAGVPVSIKDNLLTKGFTTTAGSRLLQRYQPPEDATCVKRLRSEDAIILGKTAMDEFGMGSSSENCAYGVVRNPLDLSLVPGGSSGGSAASVAAGSALLSLGSDTGGSIRQPAAFCGVVGLKPSYGRVSRYGLVAYASSLDTVGPMARSVSDLTHCLAVIAGPDPRDLTSLSESTNIHDVLRETEEAFSAVAKPLRQVRLGIWKEALEMPQLASHGRQALEEALRTLTSLGASIIPISMPRLRAACAAYYVLASSEASANLARYDGVRYGVRDVDAETAAEMTRRTRTLGLGAEVKRRIMLGTFALSSGYVDAYYRRAMQVRQLVKRDFELAFQQCDYLIGPVSPAGAFALGTKAGVDLYAEDVLTVPASLAGLPALALPCNPKATLPTGMQIMGRYGDDVGVLRLGIVYERVTRPLITSDEQ
ncbi:hypothetical protein CCYA_CCYA09G2737 [Cyanidiococcus yangmingshanensis]|nr:hypothetical protein CCYA_CCYA09G2737 [Cyanidiococcus yangmingshanensis]